jgi:hypothetical protein
MTEVSTYTVTLYVAGDCESAKRWLRRECYERGLCVTVTPTTFIYTGGEEAGVAIGFVNYPRFPSAPEAIWELAVAIARAIVPELCQRTALLVAADRTEWVTIDPPGAAP